MWNFRVELPSLPDLAADAQAGHPAPVVLLRAERVPEVGVHREDAEVPSDLEGQQEGRVGIGGPPAVRIGPGFRNVILG